MYEFPGDNKEILEPKLYNILLVYLNKLFLLHEF